MANNITVVMYHYGGWNNSLTRLLRRHGCVAGLTIEPKIADLKTDDPLTLPRLDTNDLPCDAR